jgi:hypothetical protein
LVNRDCFLDAHHDWVGDLMAWFDVEIVHRAGVQVMVCHCEKRRDFQPRRRMVSPVPDVYQFEGGGVVRALNQGIFAAT